MLEAEGPHAEAPAKVERKVYVTMTREGQSITALVGGGSKLERIQGALSILRWNRLGRAWAKRTGNVFPKDAPVHTWQVNWKSVLQKGNV
jgi:hypothetical protein